MKSAISSRTLLVITALLSSILTCHGKDDPSDLLVGKWTKHSQEITIIFNMTSDHKFQVEFTGDDVQDVWGSYAISGTQITFTDEGGDYSSGESGVYEFKLSDSSLTLTEVNDPVDGRRTLVEGTWSKAKDDK